MLAGSMTAAARELFTSQPNISRLITQLERETGLLLFQRSGVRLIPTSEGNAFFREVERAYVGLQGLTNAAAQIKNLGSGRLRIAAMPSAGLTLVPHVIKRFQELRPEVTVSLHVNTSGTVNHWTSSQFCDLGVAVYKSEASTCEVELLSEAAAVCVLPAGHRLAKKSVLKAEDFRVNRSSPSVMATAPGRKWTKPSNAPGSNGYSPSKRSIRRSAARWCVAGWA